MSLCVQWKKSRDALNLLSEPYLGVLQSWVNTPGTTAHFPKLYFSYNAKTQQTTIITTDLNRSHLWMIQHLKELSGLSIRPEEIGRLLVQYFVVVQECFTTTATLWDEKADGTVCCNKLHLNLCLPHSQQEMASQICKAVRTTMPVFGILNWMPEL